MNQNQARQRIKALKDFYSHLASYMIVHIFFVALNLFLSPEHLWFFYSLGGWGIGLAIHAFDVFGTSKGWEDRKMEELTGWRETKDELEHLRERTEVLVSILTNVSWERIDPELLDTGDNLKAAQENIVHLREQMDDNNAIDRQKIVREIEKLEAFVTSPRFQFLDKAQQ